MTNSSDTINIPRILLKKIENSFEEIEEVHEELETILMTNNPAFIKKMRQAKAEQVTGKTRSLKEFKADLCIK